MYVAKQEVRVKGARKELRGIGATKPLALAALREELLQAVGNNSYKPGPITFATPL